MVCPQTSGSKNWTGRVTVFLKQKNCFYKEYLRCNWRAMSLRMPNEPCLTTADAAKPEGLRGWIRKLAHTHKKWSVRSPHSTSGWGSWCNVITWFRSVPEITSPLCSEVRDEHKVQFTKCIKFFTAFCAYPGNWETIRARWEFFLKLSYLPCLYYCFHV